jgi:hypothetical protein
VANEDDSKPEPSTQTEAVLDPESEAESESEVQWCYNNKASILQYTYTPVPAAIRKPIRLLTLLPGTGDADIQCLLKTADLEAFGKEGNERFEALSYVWADITETTPVQIDNATIRIGRSLGSFST